MRRPLTLAYLHGLNSSSRSTKAQRLAGALAPLAHPPRLLVPDLPHRPAEAVARIEEAIGGVDPCALTLIGSSLGGFYATWIAEQRGCRCVLINPTTAPYADLERYLGPQRNLYTGETWELDRAHLAELERLRVPRITRPERYLLLVQTGDEVLDWRLASAFYAGAFQYVQGGGDHAFRGFAEEILTILRFAGWSG
jgi:predicted esterase YcpF (UPF0227 family)